MTLQFENKKDTEMAGQVEDDELFFDFDDEQDDNMNDDEGNLGSNTLIDSIIHIPALPSEEPSHHEIMGTPTYRTSRGSSGNIYEPVSIGDVIVPPMNFSMVNPGIYRSGYPNRKNFSFLLKLKIKTILYVGKATYISENSRFLRENGITLFQCPTDGNQEPFVSISFSLFQSALNYILDERNHPILIHCFKGKHQTGCLVGCIRKLQQWGLMSIFDEYKRFCGNRTRSLDYQFIELFQPKLDAVDKDYLPSWVTIIDK